MIPEIFTADFDDWSPWKTRGLPFRYAGSPSLSFDATSATPVAVRSRQVRRLHRFASPSHG